MPPGFVIASSHDYVWARLPFLVPMAVKLARTGRDARLDELAHLLADLELLLLGHLGREEAELDARGAVGTLLRARMHTEHAAVISQLAAIRTIVGDDYRARDDADATERALFDELARLDLLVQRQIELEEQLMAVP